MDKESKLLISALGQAVAQKPMEAPTEELDWQRFHALARAHNVEALAYQGLKNAGLLNTVPEEVGNQLSAACFRCVYREAQLDHVKSILQEELTREQIPHIFLKGICIKNDYPDPALRTMCDVDVLVYTKDYGKIAKIAEAHGATPGHSDGNHRNYRFPGNVEVEFHPNMLHHATPVGTQINPGWQYAKKDNPTCSMELTEEGFYLNVICHMANHFVAGGVGVRFVLDVWVCRHLRKTQPNRALVEKELESFGLLEFTCNVEALADAWFGEGELTPFLVELGEYFVTSGSHGVSDRAILNAVALSARGTGTSALLGKAFYPRAEMEDRFPWCKGKPWLLPAAWCTRAFLAVKNHGSHILRWGKGTSNISKEEVEQQRQKLAAFGIRPAKKR